MRIRRVQIENYRGIKNLDWIIPSDKRLVCLIGPGDSTKSTILEAINLALSDRWNVPVVDTDFFEAATDQELKIRVAVSDLSSELKVHGALGMHLSGIDDKGEWVHDPLDGYEPCLIVQYKVGAEMEPTWTAYRPGGVEDEVPVSSSARRHFSVFKVDERIDLHLRWSRASALSKLTDRTHGTAGTLATANRAARQAVRDSATDELKALTETIRVRLNQTGGGNFQSLNPGLDSSLGGTSGNLALFEGEIPLTNFGLGTRRIAGITTQQMAASDRPILLIDEIEYGLEPHRLVHLLHNLRARKATEQTFVTTHSPIAIEQLDMTDMAVVRSDEGTVDVKFVPSTLNGAQAAFRARPSSFLARRVLVTEGKTEHGLMLGLLDAWDRGLNADGHAPSAALGSVIQDGQGGSTAIVRALVLSDLGYETSALIDNDDRSIDKAVAAAEARGLVMNRWEVGNSTECELVSALDAKLLSALLALATQTRVDIRTVLGDLNKVTPVGVSIQNLDVATWITEGKLDLPSARGVIASAAKESEWFKRVDAGKMLAAFVIENQAQLDGSRFMSVLTTVKTFMYDTIGVDGSDLGDPKE